MADGDNLYDILGVTQENTEKEVRDLKFINFSKHTIFVLLVSLSQPS